MAVPTTMLKIVGYRGSTCVTLRYPLKGMPKYPPALVTMLRRPQYVWWSRRSLGATPYSKKISRHMYQPRESYAFWRSNNTSNSNTSLMAVSCCSSLASREAAPIPQPDRNPCSTSWLFMSDMSRWFRSLVTDFQSTSTRPATMKSPLSHLGISNTVCHVLYLYIVPYQRVIQ